MVNCLDRAMEISVTAARMVAQAGRGDCGVCAVLF
jgi:hypothetical protein